MDDSKKVSSVKLEAVNGGSCISNSKIKDHVGEALRFSYGANTETCLVVLQKVDFKENFFFNDCIVYVRPASWKDEEYMEKACKEDPSEIIFYRNDTVVGKQYKVGYGVLNATYLE